MAKLTKTEFEILSAGQPVNGNLNQYQGFAQPQTGITPLFYSRIWLPNEEIANEEIKFEGTSLYILNGFLPFSTWGELPAPFNVTIGKNGYITFKPRVANAYDLSSGVLEREILPLYGRMAFHAPFDTLWLNWRGTFSDIDNGDYWAFQTNRLFTSPIWMILSKETLHTTDLPKFENTFRYGVHSDMPTTQGDASITFYIGEQPCNIRIHMALSDEIVNPLSVDVYNQNYAVSSTLPTPEYSWSPAIGIVQERTDFDLADLNSNSITFRVIGGGASETARLIIWMEMIPKC